MARSAAAALRFPPLPSLKNILSMYNLQAKKQLAQNFILDERLAGKIVRKAQINPKCHVLEVGPGPGSLTRSIMRNVPARFTVVEKDRRFKPTMEMLNEAFLMVNRTLDVVFDDITRVNMNMIFSPDLKKDWDDEIPDIRIIGNLPFNVSTHLIIKWLHMVSEQRGPWSYGRVKMTLTFQKEVAERIVADPMSAQRCRLSLMAQAYTKPTLHFVIPGRAFVPAPDVDVGVVSLTPLKKPLTTLDFKLFEKLCRTFFRFRQKYLRRCVETLFPVERGEELVPLMFKLAEIEPTRRSFELTVDEVDRLGHAYLYIIEKHPEIGLYEYEKSNKLRYTVDSSQMEISDTAIPDQMEGMDDEEMMRESNT